MEQALFNLLDNAAKYAPEGSLVRIEGWREGDKVSLTILDEGEGFPEGDEADLRHLLPGEEERPGPGRDGPGLAISRGFVEAMAGGSPPATARTGPARPSP